MKKKPPGQIPLPPEVAGYIQGLKDLTAVQADMIAQRTAEAFALRGQLAAAVTALEAARKKNAPAPLGPQAQDGEP